MSRSLSRWAIMLWFILDQRFTLLPIQCLGTCDHAPALMIDDDLFRDLNAEELNRILKQYEKGNHGNTAD